VAERQDGGQDHAGAPSESSQSRKKLIESERFDEVVIGAGVETRDPIDDRITGGEHQNWDLQPARAERARHRDAITTRQHVVEHHRIVLVQRSVLKRILTIAHEIDSVRPLAKAASERRAEERVVFHHEQSHEQRVCE
jgi:hypothetical protein